MINNKRLNSSLSEATTILHDKIDVFEQQVLREYQIALKEVRTKLKEIENRYGADTVLTQQYRERLRNIETQIIQTLKKLHTRFNEFTTKAIADIYSESWNRTGHAIESAVHANLGFGLINGRAVESALKNQYGLIKWNTSSARNLIATIDKIRSEITQGIIQGKTFAQTSTAIADAVNISSSKSVRIVRTETHRALNSARLDSFDGGEASLRELGLTTTRKWIATIDNRTRHDHRKLDGKTADEHGFFYFDGGGKTKAPVHSGIAREDINCRCTVGLEIKGMKAERRRIKGEGVVNYKTYDEWVASKTKN